MKRAQAIASIFLCVFTLVLVGCNKPEQTSNMAANQGGSQATSQPGAAAAGGSTAPAAEKAAEAPKPIVVPAGTTITVKLANAVGSKTSSTGDTFMANVAEPVTVDGKDVIPVGADAKAKVVEAQAMGKIKGGALLKLELTSVTIKGKEYEIQSSVSSRSEKGKGKRTAVTTGGGGALGAIIGGIAGGGKGAAIGALAGAGAGLAGGAYTGNKEIELPAETALSFELKAPLTIQP